MEKTFCKVTTTAKKACYLLTTLHEHGQEGIDVCISDGTSAWSGSLTEDALDKLAVKIKMDYNSLVSQTVQAFSGKSSKRLTFQYHMKVVREDAIEFTWKKFVADQDIKFQLGSMVLLPNDDPGEVVCQIFDHAVSSLYDSNTRITTLEAENNKLSQERGNVLKRLEKCVSAKEDLEKDLYSKFVAVLNSKKQKIRQLKRNLEEGGFGSSGGEPVPSTSKLSAPADDPSDDETNNGIADIKRESGSEVNTDDEAATPKRKGRAKPKVQARQKGQGAADDSLILDDARDTAAEGTVVVRPSRQRGGNKKQTPSKPVLPKAASGSKRKASDESSLDSAKKSSLRKGRSDQSNRSSDNIEADDLFDDL